MWRNNMADEDAEVFEITDFTTASEWERFIAQIEEVIHEWKVANATTLPPLKPGELANGDWQEKTEQICFADFKFSIVRHQLKQEEEVTEVENVIETDSEEEQEFVPTSFYDMLSTENDFPARAHCLCRWYGLRDFLVISPAIQSESITQESRMNILLSSVAIAINNTGCTIPIFVQIHKKARRLFSGICECPGMRMNYEMVHLQRVPKQYHHLNGLLDLFKSKLACPISPMPPVSVSVRFTYVLNDWTNSSWTQAPPDLDSTCGSIVGCDSFSDLPFGAMEDPVSELHLSTTWPTLSEDMIVDNSVYTDLDPLQAPYWAVRVRMTDDPQCLLTDYLNEFVKVCRRSESNEQLLGRKMSMDDSETGDISQALQRLTEPVPYHIPSLSSVMSKATTRMSIKPEEAPIPADVLNEILLFLFPDAKEDGSKDVDIDYKEEEIPDEIRDIVRKFKAAPTGSLTERLAVCFCLVNYSHGGLRAMAHLWQELVLEMRYRLENGYVISGLELGSPNLGMCLLHQKLQMLNCCIQRKKKRDERHLKKLSSYDRDDFKSSTASASAVSINSSRPDSPTEDSSLSDDEFYECEESWDEAESDTMENDDEKPGEIEGESSMDTDKPSLISQSSSAAEYQDSLSHKPDGRFRQCADLKLLNLDEPLFIPMTQEPSPMTEDMLEEQADVLTKLGTSAEGAHLRARMQSASLLSDMESFKAANPGCVLEDFVRWYSPRDYVEEDGTDDGGKPVKKGQLSQRMQIAGNMWVEVWHSAKPLPARRQKRLFDDTKEAEKVLHFLAALKPAEVALHLMPCLIQSAIVKILKIGERDVSSLQALMNQIVDRTAACSRAPQPMVKKYEDIIIKHIQLAETVIARAQSLKNKFTHQKQDSPTRQAELEKFVSSLLDQPEVDVIGAARGPAGKIIHKLFASAQRSSHMILEDQMNDCESRPPSTVPDFPEPAGKEYILRTTVPRPAPYSRPTPQRMFCVLIKEDCRFAGAFSEDTTFM
ncbi:rab3 GTPase-activating protein catalytic subunit-like isoform X2 [Tubulanus polymorphus]|uniref:rab3 GTPase-activating protein catalytic subunit-like isoform X2 n=1 Tax=Tubulanus polymorphus TaxID=672921 RepID=UPI003DA48522